MHILDINDLKNALFFRPIDWHDRIFCQIIASYLCTPLKDDPHINFVNIVCSQYFWISVLLFLNDTVLHAPSGRWLLQGRMFRAQNI